MGHWTWAMGHGLMPVAGRDFLPIDALFDVEPKGAVLRACFPLLPPIRFPGLSRCGVSDGVAPQRAVARIGQPIRGPDAGQSRQPQRVQPGDANAVSEYRLVRLFSSLFGRSKRGHPDSSHLQDDYTEEGTQPVRSPNHIERERYLPAQRSPTECRRTGPCGGPAVGVGQCDWPHRRQGGSPVNPRLAWVMEARGAGRSIEPKGPRMFVSLDRDRTAYVQRA
jgi:hypothetical protein